MNAENKKPHATPGDPKGVGYCSPPTNTRFQKGVSGNPKGRPKGSLNVATVFAKALREKVVINERGLRRKVTKLEAALKQLVNRAAAGDLRALRHLLELAHDAETKPMLPDQKDSVLGDIDREVIAGIMKRFGISAENKSQDEEESDGTNDRS